jgi:ABC-2 type transport system ATP-binding protein
LDVGLRHDMWQMVRRLREDGVTIILTTHYIEHWRSDRLEQRSWC